LSTNYKCTLSDISHKLDVSGHMLLWTFFLVLVRGTRAENVFPFFQFHCVYITWHRNNFTYFVFYLYELKIFVKIRYSIHF
jgi:hypothetical protein